jgi:hypothetical protein
MKKPKVGVIGGDHQSTLYRCALKMPRISLAPVQCVLDVTGIVPPGASAIRVKRLHRPGPHL